MSWNCVICYEPLLALHTICAVICGHVFHEECIDKWLSSSKSCPQCRKKCLAKDIVKLFFNQANLDDNKESAAELQSLLDDLKLQLSEKLKVAKDQEAKIKKLKDSLKKIKNENESLNAVNMILREKDEMNRAQLSKVDSLMVENRAMNTKLTTLTKLERVLNGTADDVEKLLCCETDLHQMATFQVSLKRALSEAEQKKHATYRMYEAQKGQLERAHKSIAELQCNISSLEEEIKSKEDTVQKLEQKCLQKNSQHAAKIHNIPVKEASLHKGRRKSISTDDENIFDTAFVASQSDAHTTNGIQTSRPKASLLSTLTTRASSPYHHLSHGSITASLRTANSKIKDLEKKSMTSTTRALAGSKLGSNGMKLSLNHGASKRTIQQTRTTYQTTKLPQKDNRFNFSLSPPRSMPYKTYNLDGPYSISVTKKSPCKVPKLSTKILKRIEEPESSGMQNIKNFFL